MSLTSETIRLALTRVAYPAGGGDVVSVGAVKKIAACDGYVSIRVAAAGLHGDQRAGLKQQATAAVRLAAQQIGAEVHEVHVEFVEERPESLPPPAAAKAPAPPSPHGHAEAPRADLLPNVKKIIAVGAGKGGVGKSTIAVNLAVALARRGHAVGLMDGDIYGPSLPTMLGLSAHEAIVRPDRMLEPFYVAGVKAMTIGKLVDPEKPLVWRGPMAHGAFKQLVEQTNWGDLDYMIIDLPPGTGDVSLTMAQNLRVTGAVVVCTPQKVAQDDAVRAARMFQSLGIDVLGVVENMSWFVGDDGKEYDLFGRGGAQMMAQRLNLPFLGAVPINMGLRKNSDDGDPEKNFTDRSARNAPLADALERVTTNLESQVALAAMRSGAARPTLSIS